MSNRSVGQAETLPSQLERNTWSELERLARDLPETGIHFQGSTLLI